MGWLYYTVALNSSLSLSATLGIEVNTLIIKSKLTLQLTKFTVDLQEGYIDAIKASDFH